LKVTGVYYIYRMSIELSCMHVQCYARIAQMFGLYWPMGESK